jgi:hypothetical protein
VFIGKPLRPCSKATSSAARPSNKTGVNSNASASVPLPNSCSAIQEFLAKAEVPLQHLYPLFIKLGLKDKVRQTPSHPLPTFELASCFCKPVLSHSSIAQREKINKSRPRPPLTPDAPARLLNPRRYTSTCSHVRRPGAGTSGLRCGLPTRTSRPSSCMSSRRRSRSEVRVCYLKLEGQPGEMYAQCCMNMMYCARPIPLHLCGVFVWCLVL